MGVRICLGCLNEVTDQSQRCPRCDFSLADPVPLNVLIPKTMLNGRYVIGKAFYSDGEGISYAAYDVQTNIPVAIREYMPSAIAHRSGTEVIETTGATAKYKALKSDFMELHRHLAQWNSLTNVRKIYSVFEQNNTGYAVGEHLNAITLNQYLNENAGELDWNVAGQLFLPLLESISQINKSGFIHRGLSPENILVMSDGTLKLIGFSICSARVTNSEIECSLADGYAAPEQYNVAPHGEWTDVYGACAVIYRTITGTRPPSAPTRQVNDNLTSPNTLNTTIPSHVSRAIMEGLAYETTQRTQSLEYLIGVLYSGLDHTTAFNTASVGSPLFNPYEKNQRYDTGYNTGYNETVEDDEKSEKKGFFNQFFEETDEIDEDDRKKSKKIAWDDDYEDEKYNKNGKKGKNGKNKKPIWAKILICSLPVIFIIFILLYQAMIGFSFFGGNKDKANSKTSSAVSSQVSSAASSSKATSSAAASSQEPSAPSQVTETGMINMVGMYSEVITDYSGTYRFTESKYEYNEQYLEGQICAQSVPEGTMLSKNDTVTLTISKGSQFIVLPSYIGLKPDQYIAKLLELGITATVEREFSSDVFEGYITRTSPEAGSSIDRTKGTAVLIYESKGLEPMPSKPEPPPSKADTSSAQAVG